MMPSSGTNLTLQRRHCQPLSTRLLEIGLFVYFVLFNLFLVFETGSHMAQTGLEFSLSHSWLQIPCVAEASLGLDLPKCCNLLSCTTTPGVDLVTLNLTPESHLWAVGGAKKFVKGTERGLGGLH